MWPGIAIDHDSLRAYSWNKHIKKELTPSFIKNAMQRRLLFKKIRGRLINKK